MATKDEIVGVIEQTDARIEALRDRILVNGETPLAEGTWRVRDVLSHLAARANGVDRILRRVEAATNPSAGGPPPPAPGSIDEINAAQVDERTDKSVAELLDEIRQGHRAAIEQIKGLDDALLARMVPLGFRPGEASVGDIMMMGGSRHDNGHLDQVEAVV